MPDKPLRGPPVFLDHWHDFDVAMGLHHFPPTTVVVDEQQHAEPVLPTSGPLLLSYDPGSSETSPLQWIDTIRDQSRALWEAHRFPELSPEDQQARIDDMISGWATVLFGDDQSFYVRENYGRVPSKRDGRKGTRRNWKRSHPPKKAKWTWMGKGRFSIDPPPRMIHHTVIISPEGIINEPV